MDQELICIATDWWTISATLIAGALSAVATICAVVYTNKETIKQLNAQKMHYDSEREKQNKLDKMVFLKPILILSSFDGLLDMLIVKDIWDRVLLISGDDGFEFFDDPEKSSNQRTRILLIENRSENDIKSVAVKTKSIFTTDTDEKLIYETENFISLLRAKEDIVCRLLNQAQYESIIKANKGGRNSELRFMATVKYTTLANQRVKYIYEVLIKNDRRIEVVKDEVEKIEDIRDNNVSGNHVNSVFRNLQDSISGIDRSSYNWRKIGKAQMDGMLSMYNSNNVQQVTMTEGKKNDEV